MSEGVESLGYENRQLGGPGIKPQDAKPLMLATLFLPQFCFTHFSKIPSTQFFKKTTCFSPEFFTRITYIPLARLSKLNVQQLFSQLA